METIVPNLYIKGYIYGNYCSQLVHEKSAHLASLVLSPPFLLRLMVGCFWKALSF